MAAAGPALWDVTADPRRPQNSQAKGVPSSTVPGSGGDAETDSRLLARRDPTWAQRRQGGGTAAGHAHLGRGGGVAPARPRSDTSSERSGAAGPKLLGAARGDRSNPEQESHNSCPYRAYSQVRDTDIKE